MHPERSDISLTWQEIWPDRLGTPRYAGSKSGNGLTLIYDPEDAGSFGHVSSASVSDGDRKRHRRFVFWRWIIADQTQYRKRAHQSSRNQRDGRVCTNPSVRSPLPGMSRRKESGR